MGAAGKADDEINVHGTKGIYRGGEWVQIEDLGEILKKSKSERCKPCRSRSGNSAAKSDGSYDIVIVGAGCIGSAIARELSKTTASVLLLEGADDVTQGATKGNSGIVHAGYDDKPGSVRAQFCWPGNQMFPQLDRELHFGYQKTGSLVVAKNSEDEAILEDLMERGRKNGVKNIRIIKQEELRKLEPAISKEATAALYSPDAGTITPYEYTIALAENAVDNGVELRIRRVVTGIKQLDDGGFIVTANHWEPHKRLISKKSILQRTAYTPVAALFLLFPLLAKVVSNEQALAGIISLAVLVITVDLVSNFSSGATGNTSFSPSQGTNLGGPSVQEEFKTKYIVNAAGCSSDTIAQLIGDKSFKIKPRLGEYILLHKEEGHKARHILFPTPHPFLGKGVLVQQTLWGNMILGPTARDTLKKNEETGEYEVDPKVRDEPKDSIMHFILSKCTNLVPSLQPQKVIHTFAGARAKNTTGDWVIRPSAVNPQFIHAAGIDSPGIAGSPAIAVEVVKLLKQVGAPVEELDESFNPFRAPLITPKDGWRGLKTGAIGKITDPEKNVICKCEKVTEAEVIEACRRSLPIDSTQAIRKRTRAGMGHCQGDPDNYSCEDRVAAIMARELNVKLEDIGRRPWPASSMLPQRFVTDKDREHLKSLAEK